MTQPPTTHFATFNDLFNADPYGLAAAAIDLFHQPKIHQHRVQTWLRSLVQEKGSTFLGLNISEPPPLEATEHRIVLIWERAMVASRTLEGADHAYASVLLLDPRIRTLPYQARLSQLRAAAGVPDLR